VKIYLRAARYLRGRVWLVAIGIFFLFLSLGAQLFRPWPVKWAIDFLLSAPLPSASVRIGSFGLSPWQAILGASIALFAAGILGALARLAADRAFLETGLGALARLRTDLFWRLEELSLPFHLNRPSADSVYRVAYDTQAIQTILQRGLLGAALSLATLAGTLAILFRLDRVLAGISLLVVPLLAVAVGRFAGRIRRKTEEFHRKESELLSQTSEALSSIVLLQAYNLQGYKLGLFQKQVEESRLANTELLFTSSLSQVALEGISALGTALLLAFGAREVWHRHISVGDLWIFLNYLGLLYHPLEELSYMAWALEGAAAGLGRVFEVLDLPDPVPDQPDSQPLPRLKGSILLKEVTFGYRRGIPVLKGVTLEAPAGSRVAVVGPSGAGKTTVLALIARFFDPESGAVLVDGIDVRTVTKRSLREQLAFVLQETSLFEGTVEENIACGRLGAGHEEIREAACLAQAHHFIKGLPQGYCTRVGERGAQLSGGERQRIGLARAFLRNAPVLLLDEPTSALDPKTEADLLEALRRLQTGRTTLWVTHRLPLVHDADWIYVLDKGRIVEEGTGEELLRKEGMYAALWQKATQGGRERDERPKQEG
jgi:ABC-type multidrug transport system fused ATPase/permease subunit